MESLRNYSGASIQTVAHCFIVCAMTSLMACSRGTDDGGTPSDAVDRAPVADERPVILFMGDSLTAGYHMDPDEAFPALIQNDVDGHNLRYRVVNAGVSGDSSLDGLNRIDWVLAQPAHVLVLALGANDALRGQPASFTEDNLRALLQRARERYPDIRLVVVGMKMPANYGEPYRGDFESIFPRLAEAFDAELIPFLLEGVAGDPDLNFPDGIHPTPEGHRIMARTVWPHLQNALTK